MHTSISSFLSLACMSPVPPGHSTSSIVLPASLATSWSRGERKCSRCQPTRRRRGAAILMVLLLKQRADVGLDDVEATRADVVLLAGAKVIYNTNSNGLG